MRKKIIAGNWKMNKTTGEGVHLVEETLQLLSGVQTSNVIVIFCPSFIALEKISEIIRSKEVFFSAAQNCSTENSGAFTGEISPPMIHAAGAAYVIIGHSERRQYFGETNQQLAKKANVALESGLNVIFCVGEMLEVREAGAQQQLVEQQLREGLFHLNKEQFKNIVIAYEPVWAIGTGKVASDEQAQEMHAFIRETIARKYSPEFAQKVSILYGGSCKPSNAKGLFSQPDVDGGLIGGASLVAADFAEIIKSI